MELQTTESELPALGWETPEKRLENSYSKCRMNQYVDGHYAKYENGKLSVCGIGWALKAAGWTDQELKADQNIGCLIKSITSYKDPSKALDEYGFSKEVAKKQRTCPMPDCVHTGRLRHMLEHLNESHRIPIPNIGKLIPLILKENTKPKTTIADHLVALKKDIKQLILAK